MSFFVPDPIGLTSPTTSHPIIYDFDFCRQQSSALYCRHQLLVLCCCLYFRYVDFDFCRQQLAALYCRHQSSATNYLCSVAVWNSVLPPPDDKSMPLLLISFKSASTNSILEPSQVFQV
ncbi:unnamed protein product [Lactuca virosa]|uniref:Uncharacterized protein n=1 Tax=Lactuca virosa TaxID=75947 RepID=A0AAU9M1K3_9ASTR|nr:unnamed protein product [Lactuca virosa]